ncbi:MAG: VWA domain-containing protein [Chitinophagales bacterium]
MKKLLFSIVLCVLIYCIQGCKMKQKSEEATESISEVTVEAVDEAKPLPDAVSYELQPEDIMLNQKEVDYNTEQYDHIQENEFKSAKQQPLSTFSIDVDRASYANVRRFITSNQLPPAGAVRIEELVNYFDYKYPQPATHPFSINTEYGTCPWNKEHQLVLIGLQGKEFKQENTPPFNLTFLLDVSGSMDEANKLPLVKESMKLLIDKMRDEDYISIVVYAGNSGLVLKPTNGKNKEKIYEALDNLQAGGSTAGGEGIELAYKTARENYAKNKINRVILATDGDFNVGVSSDDALVRLIERERISGVFLTVLGFGTGNYKDSKMEKLADKGNGNYAYIDNLLEAKKSLVKEMGGTLQTIAKDVKIQVEFNPAKVKGYRLVGYENRLLNNEDFNDDTKDAGELGAGHTVTALYEIIPAGSNEEIGKTDALKYQKTDMQLSALNSDELMTVKFRYKLPNEDKSILLEHIVKAKTLNATITNNFQWASTVAQFGMLLRDSKFKGNTNYKNLLAQAKAYKSNDDEGYRAEMIQLIEKAEMLKR